MDDDTTAEEAELLRSVLLSTKNQRKKSQTDDNMRNSSSETTASIKSEEALRARLIENLNKRKMSEEKQNSETVPEPENESTQTMEDAPPLPPDLNPNTDNSQPLEIGTQVESDIRARMISRMKTGSELPEKVSADPIKKPKKEKKDKKSKKSKKDKKQKELPENIVQHDYVDGIYYEDKAKEERFYREGCIKYGMVPKFEKYERTDVLNRVKKKSKPMRYFGKRAQRLLAKGVKFELQTNRIAEAVIRRVEIIIIFF